MSRPASVFWRNVERKCQRWSPSVGPGRVDDVGAVVAHAEADFQVVHLRGVAPQPLVQQVLEVLHVLLAVLHVAGLVDLQQGQAQEELAPRLVGQARLVAAEGEADQLAHVVAVGHLRAGAAPARGRRPAAGRWSRPGRRRPRSGSRRRGRPVRPAGRRPRPRAGRAGPVRRGRRRRRVSMRWYLSRVNASTRERLVAKAGSRSGWAVWSTAQMSVMPSWRMREASTQLWYITLPFRPGPGRGPGPPPGPRSPRSPRRCAPGRR